MMSENDYLDALKEIYRKYKSYSLYNIQASDSENIYEYRNIQDSWDSLCSAIKVYISWRSYSSPDIEDNIHKSIPASLETDIDLNLRDSMIIRASSLLEVAVRETNIIRITETFPWIDDFYQFDDYSPVKESDYQKLYNTYKDSLKIHLPRGKNFDYKSIVEALKSVHPVRGQAYENNFKIFSMDARVLKHLIYSRNKIAHGKDSGLSNNIEYYYLIWYAFENCRLIIHSMGTRSLLRQSIRPLISLLPEEHDIYKKDVALSIRR